MTAVVCERGPQQALVFADNLTPALTELLHKPCRTLDVGEEEANYTAWQLGHDAV